MVKVKKTPINTINIAVKLPIPKITKAIGTHAIGAIGAITDKIGTKNNSDHLDKLNRRPTIIDPTKAKLIPLNTLIKVIDMD
tara:strand:+ start:988 stop:1233 length:246 start_codon:yes stop_codon:yes gene_type:complete